MTFTDWFMKIRLQFLVVVLACSLNAPHDNPFDPSLGGTVEGIVVDRQGRGIHDAKISVLPVGREVLSDENGNFIIYSLPVDRQCLICQQLLYAQESVYVEIDKGEKDSVRFVLNGLPKLSSESIRTFHWIRSWPLDDLFFCKTEVTVCDTDGLADIDTVWLRIPDLSISSPLVYEPKQKLYNYTIWARVCLAANWKFSPANHFILPRKT